MTNSRYDNNSIVTAPATHTPGPWRADPFKDSESYFADINVVRADGLAVAVAVANGDLTAEETLANARLIAAAPTMADYIAKRAATGDAEAAAIMESIHAGR